jgi:uncharacterized protein with von Willebrand factor type A (vWA) domain
MNQTLVIPDALYQRLLSTARARGVKNVEQLLEAWGNHDLEVEQRQEIVRRIDALRERLFAKYGDMSDSVELIRADRER